MTLELDFSERDALIVLVRGRLEELRAEIHHTDHSAYRKQLKQLDDTLRRILGRLEMPDTPLLTHM